MILLVDYFVYNINGEVRSRTDQAPEADNPMGLGDIGFQHKLIPAGLNII